MVKLSHAKGKENIFPKIYALFCCLPIFSTGPWKNLEHNCAKREEGGVCTTRILSRFFIASLDSVQKMNIVESDCGCKIIFEKRTKALFSFVLSTEITSTFCSLQNFIQKKFLFARGKLFLFHILTFSGF